MTLLTKSKLTYLEQIRQIYNGEHKGRDVKVKMENISLSQTDVMNAKPDNDDLEDI
jgi:hypothetical protein